MIRRSAVTRRIAASALLAFASFAACASPAGPPPAREPAHAIEARESAQQAAVLHEHAAIHEGRADGPVLVCRQSQHGGPSPERTESILRRFPDLPRELLLALNEVNAAPVDLSDRFDPERITLVDHGWLRQLPVDDFFVDQSPGWPALRKEIPGASGAWLCSRAVEIDGRALVQLYYDTRFGDFQEYVLLDLVDGRWQVVHNFVTGVE
jgi:hypothetical protein